MNWKGNYCKGENNKKSKPSDEEFKLFFEGMSIGDNNMEFPDVGNVITPVLDDPISEVEILREARNMNSNKACGLDGITPGIFKVLPGAWLLFLVTLFNNLLSSAWYPSSWSKAKFFTIFKKGNKFLPENYRGISIISSISKLYDMILCTRLKMWFKPYREQAGSQEKRGRIEHIVCLSLLCDLARRKKL